MQCAWLSWIHFIRAGETICLRSPCVLTLVTKVLLFKLCKYQIIFSKEVNRHISIRYMLLFAFAPIVWSKLTTTAYTTPLLGCISTLQYVSYRLMTFMSGGKHTWNTSPSNRPVTVSFWKNCVWVSVYKYFSLERDSYEEAYSQNGGLTCGYLESLVICVCLCMCVCVCGSASLNH